MARTFPQHPAGNVTPEIARAFRVLKKLPEDYVDYKFAADAYFRIGAIYANKLNQPDSARVYYERQIETYPGIPPSKMAQEIIETL